MTNIVERRRRTAARKSDLDRDKEDLMLAADEIERLHAEKEEIRSALTEQRDTARARRDALIKDVERLRAEIERLRAENKQLKLALADDPDADICAENDNLTRDNERLRATIKDRDEWIARFEQRKRELVTLGKTEEQADEIASSEMRREIRQGTDH
jgi:predicted Mrr-cat superfamily restriction endonuclease